MHQYNLQKFWLRFCVGLILLSFIFLGLRIFDYALWEQYYFLYLILALTHTLYVFALLAYGDFNPRKDKKYNGGSIVVVIPCFNEEPRLFEKSVRSILKAKGNKRIVVVDDGSTNGIEKYLPELAEYYGFVLHTLPQNGGKRAALHAAFSNYISDSDIVVLVDSDTILHKNALVRIAAPLQSPSVGAASGDVQLLNENHNALTRMASAYYWTALNLERKAQSVLGMVACCSGALAAYRGYLLRQMTDEFMNETFLGERCVCSDDRHLTNLILRSGYDVVYVPEAIAYTYSPITYRAFLNQQLRWRRGFFQEAFYALSYLWKTKPILCLTILVWDIGLLFLSVGLVILIMINAIFDPAFLIFGLLPSLATLVVIRQLPLLIQNPRRLFGLLGFAFFAHFIMFWQSIYALFTLKKSSWLTR